MRHTVAWQPDCLNKLTNLWLSSSDRQAITDAANRIDQVLAHSPDKVGQEFYGDRYWYANPLHVVYSFKPKDMLVSILDVWMDP